MSTWDTITDWLLARLQDIVDGIVWFGGKVADIFTFLWNFLAEHGSADDIDKARDAWTAKDGDAASVKSNIVATRNFLQEEASSIGTLWQGPAAEAFDVYAFGREGRGGLVLCCQSLEAICDKISESLKQVRDILTAFLNWLIIVIGAFVVFVGVCIACAWFGAGVGAFFTGLTVFATAVTVAYTECRSALNECKTAVDTLQDQNTETAGFSGGKWPKPAVDLGDGSVTDGDGSSWTPQPG